MQNYSIWFWSECSRVPKCLNGKFLICSAKKPQKASKWWKTCFYTVSHKLYLFRLCSFTCVTKTELSLLPSNFRQDFFSVKYISFHKTTTEINESVQAMNKHEETFFNIEWTFLLWVSFFLSPHQLLLGHC